MLDKITRILIDRLGTESKASKVFNKSFSGCNHYLDYVFICGGNFENYTSRKDLLSIFKGKANCLISERLTELIGDVDLLTFERVLEAISQMILICLESFGTACELGAFTYITDKNVNNREVVIFDEKRRDEDSFINKGPIRVLNDLKDNRVLYTGFSKYKEGLSMSLNSEINSLYKHPLLLKKRRLKNFYTRLDQSNIVVTDLSSFFAYLVDIFSFIGYCNFNIFMNFLCTSLSTTHISIETNGIKSNDGLKPIIQCFLRIMERLDVLEKRGQYYFVNYKKINKCIVDTDFHVGEIIFTEQFCKSEKYLLFKTDFIQNSRALYDS